MGMCISFQKLCFFGWLSLKPSCFRGPSHAIGSTPRSRRVPQVRAATRLVRLALGRSDGLQEGFSCHGYLESILHPRTLKKRYSKRRRLQNRPQVSAWFVFRAVFFSSNLKKGTEQNRKTRDPWVKAGRRLEEMLVLVILCGRGWGVSCKHFRVHRSGTMGSPKVVLSESVFRLGNNCPFAAIRESLGSLDGIKPCDMNHPGVPRGFQLFKTRTPHGSACLAGWQA